MRGKSGAVAAAIAVSVGMASTASAHPEDQLRPPTAHERAQFEARRSVAARQASGGPAALGVFRPPFTEPTLGDGRATSQDCVTNEDGSKSCKPAGNSVNVLPNGKVLYWNALEGTENI